MSDVNEYIKRPLLYVAGPYAHPDCVLNTHNTIKAAEKALELGYTPVIPHLSMFWHAVVPHEIDFWYRYDLALLIKCDILVRLPGESSGSDKEVELAIEHGITVFIGMEKLPDVKEWYRG